MLLLQHIDVADATYKRKQGRYDWGWTAYAVSFPVKDTYAFGHCVLTDANVPAIALK
jgi:hypothetical protein